MLIIAIIMALSTSAEASLIEDVEEAYEEMREEQQAQAELERQAELARQKEFERARLEKLDPSWIESCETYTVHNVKGMIVHGIKKPTNYPCAIEVSADGKNWETISDYTNVEIEEVSWILFDRPVSTAYIRTHNGISPSVLVDPEEEMELISDFRTDSYYQGLKSSWSEVPGAVSYNIYRAKDIYESSDRLIGSTNKNSYQHDAKDLSMGTFWVCSVDRMGRESSPSNTDTVLLTEP